MAKILSFPGTSGNQSRKQKPVNTLRTKTIQKEEHTPEAEMPMGEKALEMDEKALEMEEKALEMEEIPASEIEEIPDPGYDAADSEDTAFSDSIFSESDSPLAQRVHAASVERRKRRVHTHVILRSLIQLFFFLLMPQAFYAGFCGAKDLAAAIGSGVVLPWNQNTRVLVVLLVFTIIFGRFFCGYVCAFGSLGDLVYALVSLFQTKVLKRSHGYSVNPKTRRSLQLLKYPVLAVILVLAVFSLLPEGTGCFDTFIDLVNWKKPGSVAGVILLLLAILLMAIQERGFCQFLCPMGALFALLPILPFGTLHRRADNCPEGCRDCLNHCPAALLLQENDERAGECYGCENCISTCPKNNITHTEDFVFRSEVIPVVLKAVLLLVLGILLGLCRFL